MIKGGYILQPRVIDSSETARFPPVTRELWSYLLRNVNHDRNERLNINRGQGFFRLADIQEDLKWYSGYRKNVYSKPQLTKSLRRLREGNMVETTKETRGLLITICNYDYYQDPKNYGGNDEETVKGSRKKSKGRTINKNGKNNNNDNKKTCAYSSEFELFWEKYPKKIGKGAAYKSWNKVDTSDGMVKKILEAVGLQKKSEDWLKDNGKFIPHPTTWLNQARWDDEVESMKTNSVGRDACESLF